VHHGQDIVLADVPVAFAGAVTALLQDVELRRRYERTAAALAAKYDWTAIGDKFGQVLETVAGTQSRESSRYVGIACVSSVRG
jgi:glycosyltransferase involved in cell wall biosynthesis